MLREKKITFNFLNKFLGDLSEIRNYRKPLPPHLRGVPCSEHGAMNAPDYHGQRKGLVPSFNSLSPSLGYSPLSFPHVEPELIARASS